MGIAILALIILGYLVLAYFATRTWQVGHVVLLVFLFLATVGFSILTAATFKTHKEFRSKYNAAKTELDRENTRTEELDHGDVLAASESAPSVRILENRVSRDLIDRGRVWRNLALKDRNEESITLDSTGWDDPDCKSIGSAEEYVPIEPVPAEGGAANANQTRPTGLFAGTVVFAFRETPVKSLSEELQKVLLGESTIRERDAKGVCRVPTAYLGQFRVDNVAADNTTIVLKPEVKLSDRQTQILQEGNFRWVLYEKMPTDSHESFAGLSEDQLKVLLPSQDLGLEADAYLQFLKQYVKDQQRAEDADPPERKWVRLKFLKEYTIAVDMQQPVPEPAQPFDPTGRSQSAILRQDAESKLAEGAEGTFDSQTAARLIKDGIAELIEPIYVRQLRDYEKEFLSQAQSISALNRDLEQAGQELASLQQSIERLKGQIESRADERTKLAADKEGFDYERQVITEYRQALEAKWQSLRDELSRLYQANRQLVPSDFQTFPSSSER